MRLLVTADLHFNHARSRPLAERLIDEMNGIDADVLLVIGDSATSEDGALEACLSRFTFPGPKLFVAGNHELWTRGPDSHHLHHAELPRRVNALGWHWLEHEPFVHNRLAIVGSIGWYDYSFAAPRLGIPRRFYERKMSPGAAKYLKQHDLDLDRGDVPPAARDIVARWNDGRHVKLGRSDHAFLDELLETLERQLRTLRHQTHIVAAIHHVPFAELLPPTGHIQRDFAHAYLGSNRIGQLLQRFDNVKTVLCGHSHFPARATINQINAINLGAGYRKKEYLLLDLPL